MKRDEGENRDVYVKAKIIEERKGMTKREEIGRE